MKTIWLTFGALAALLILACVLLTQHHPESPQSVWKQGQRLIYNLEMNLNGTSLLTSPSIEAKSRVKGLLQCDVLKVNAKGTMLRLQVNATETSSDVPAAAFASHPALVYVKSDGTLERADIPSELHPFVATYLRTLASALQVSLPDENAKLAPTWQVVEHDMHGAFLSQYTRAKNSRSELILTKKNLGYQDLETGQISVDVSRTSLRIDHAKSILSKLTSEQEVTFLSGSKVLAKNQTSIQLSLTSIDSIGASKISRSSHYEPLELARASDMDFARNTLQALTLDDLLQQLENHKRGQDIDEARLERQFHALIRLHPEHSARLGDVLKKARRGTFAFHALLGALAQVGHTQAQATLREVFMVRKHEWNEASSILIAMGQMQRPDKKTIELYSALYDDKSQARLGSIASLALGTSANRLADTNRQASKQIVERFSAELEGAPDPQKARHILLVLGNAGSPDALASILPYTRHPDPLVRANAALALRFDVSGAAHDVLIKMATSDVNESVRREAIHVLALQGLGSEDIDVIANVARLDTDFGVAQAGMEALAQTRDTKAMAAIQEIAQNGLTQKRRDTAKALMQRAQSSTTL